MSYAQALRAFALFCWDGPVSTGLMGKPSLMVHDIQEECLTIFGVNTLPPCDRGRGLAERA